MRGELETCPDCGEQRDAFHGHGNYRPDGAGFCARCGRTMAWHAGTTCFCRHGSGLPISIRFLNATLDAWLEVRVAAHRARGDAQARVRAIDVPTYLRLLALVRRAEDIIDPWRRELGARDGRAYELVTTDRQLELEVAA